jgi:hypothetical protein
MHYHSYPTTYSYSYSVRCIDVSMYDILLARASSLHDIGFAKMIDLLSAYSLESKKTRMRSRLQECSLTGRLILRHHNEIAESASTREG